MFKISIEGSGPGPIGAPPQDVEVMVNGHVIKGVKSIRLGAGVELEFEKIPLARVDLILAAGASVAQTKVPPTPQVNSEVLLKSTQMGQG